MSDDWLPRFREFSLVADVIQNDTFDHIKNAVARYLDEGLGAHYFRVLVDGVSYETEDGDAIPGLDCLWTNDKLKIGGLIPILSVSERKRLGVLSYLERKPMWIVARDGGVLDDVAGKPEAVVDLWSNVSSLPGYRPAGEKPTRTAIFLPLEYGERRFGVMEIEFESHLPISEKGKQTAKFLADALGRIIWIWKTTETQLQGTRDAFDALEASYQPGSASPLHKHVVFVASSGRADPAVMEVILGVLAEFDDLFDVNFWKLEVATGNINEQVRTAISESEFGVCYISEPADDGKAGGPRFFDNPNVLFEAGMLQMLNELRDRRGVLVSRWIPIREGRDLSPPLPFDFAGDRIITVPRKEGDGELDSELFTEMMRASVTKLVEQLQMA